MQSNHAKCSKYHAKMTDSSSKLLQIQGKWYEERRQKKSKTRAKKKSKNYSEPFSIKERHDDPTFFLNWETRSVGLTSHHGACRGYPKAWEPGFGIVSKMGRPPIFFSGFIIMMYHISHYNSVVFLNDFGLSTRPIYALMSMPNFVLNGGMLSP